MQLIRDIHNSFPNCVATIGNYDGMHLGHQKVLTRVREQARSMHLPSLVIVFEPQSQEYFLGKKICPRLMPLREKLNFLQNYAIDLVLCLRFNNKLANLNPEQFVQKLLAINIQYLIIGDDFAFGHNRGGKFKTLAKHIKTEQVSSVQINNGKVSSTNIRQALAIGDFKTAEKMLGRPYSMSGRVGHGDRLGHKLGFPTANIYLAHRILPINGVYIAKVKGLAIKPLLAVANIGNRPTVNGMRNILEVHILNFNKDIYGIRIEVEFIEKIRDEIKFASLDLLKQQIERDINKVKRYDRV
jgi:riboflavin kinase/FMN adenylyltransferase